MILCLLGLHAWCIEPMDFTVEQLHAGRVVYYCRRCGALRASSETRAVVRARKSGGIGEGSDA